MIAVVDTSALVRLFIEDPRVPALAERLAEVTPHVPDIVDAEFHHAIRGLLLGQKATPQRIELGRGLFSKAPLVRTSTVGLMERVWSLRHNFGAYDACFVALAEGLDVPLITCDEKQASASGHRAKVETY